MEELRDDLKIANDEKVLLNTDTDEDYKVIFKNRVVVTNQRCIFFKVYDVSYPAKGMNPATGKYEEIKSEFIMEQEIKLSDIKETYTITYGSLKIKLMNGQTTIFTLSSPTTTNWGIDMMNDMVNRLANYINHIIARQ